MIPTALLVGLVLGRWWLTSVLVAAVGWPLLLLADGGDLAVGQVCAAAGLAAANAAVGATVTQLGWRGLRRARARSATTSCGPAGG